jgi:excisionase family DNA binding protein
MSAVNGTLSLGAKSTFPREQKMETQKLPRLLKIEEVCQRTSLSRSAIYRVITAGELKIVKIGKAARVLETELDRWIYSLEGESK